MYRIGEFSKLSKTTIKTLHYYDEIGLLEPEEIDKVTNYRFYSTRQLFKFHRIQAFRQIGLSIQEIKLIMSGHEQHYILEKRKSEIIDELSSIQEQFSQLEFMLQGTEEEIFMNYAATLKELPECIVYSITAKVRNYDDYFDIIPPMGEKLMKKYPDLKCSKPDYCYIVYPDGEYKEHDFHIEYCEAVDQMKPDFDDVHFKKIDAINAVSVMHKGPYSELRRAYAFIFRWIEDNGYIATQLPRESYIDGIWNKGDQKEWLTEIQVPIEKA